MALRIANTIDKMTGKLTYTLFNGEQVVFTYPVLAEAKAAVEHLTARPYMKGLEGVSVTLEFLIKELREGAKCTK